jgi:hypothetical protein
MLDLVCIDHKGATDCGVDRSGRVEMLERQMQAEEGEEEESSGSDGETAAILLKYSGGISGLVT